MSWRSELDWELGSKGCSGLGSKDSAGLAAGSSVKGSAATAPFGGSDGGNICW
jgi:hypothetical protein